MILSANLYSLWNHQDKQERYPHTANTCSNKREEGESKTVQSNNLTVSVWQDNKPVTIAATNSNPMIGEQVSRKQRDGSSIPVRYSQCVVLFNENMGVWIILTNCKDTITSDSSSVNFTNTYT